MRCLYKVAVAITFLSVCAKAQQSSYYQEVFTQARPGARVDVDGSAYHQISWVTSGAPGACYLALDYSDDGMVWNLGGTMPIRDCTHSGSSPVAGQHIRFVRMNLNTLSGSSAIRATYTGYQTNPGPTGTVTSVFGRTGDVLAQPGDYNVADITGAAPLFSPNFTGSPTSVTPPAGDNSNRIATTAFVNAIFQSCCNGGGGGTGGNATGLIFDGTTIPLGTPAPTAGQYLMFDGAHIVGSTLSGGGGGGLTGCTTPTSGNLVCDVSVQGGVGSVGMLTLPYGTSGLPTPPTTAEAAIAPDATGALFWSPGNNTAFAPIGTGGGGGQGPAPGVTTFNGRSGAVLPEADDYAAFFAPIGQGGGGPIGGVTMIQ